MCISASCGVLKGNHNACRLRLWLKTPAARAHPLRSVVASRKLVLYPSHSSGEVCAHSPALQGIGRTSRPYHLRLQRLEPARASRSSTGHTDNMPVVAWDDLDVAIVGGGPAGLATAAALLRVQPGLKLKVRAP